MAVDAYVSTLAFVISLLPEGARSLYLRVAFGSLRTPSDDMATHITEQESTSHGADLQRRTFTVSEAAKLLGISRSTAYECVRSGELESLRFRSRIVIPADAIAGLLGAGGRSGGKVRQPTE